MNIQNVVKLGVSRQVAIPIKLWRELKLKPGEYMEIKKQGTGLALQPKTFVDKDLEESLAQSIQEFREGKGHGPFETVNELFDFLDGKKKKKQFRKS